MLVGDASIDSMELQSYLKDSATVERGFRCQINGIHSSDFVSEGKYGALHSYDESLALVGEYGKPYFLLALIPLLASVSLKVTLPLIRPGVIGSLLGLNLSRFHASLRLWAVTAC
jgi:hypothetical protein